MDNKKENNIKVYKANKLIEARYKLTATEQKLILYAASQVDAFYGENFTLLKIKVSDYFKIAGLDPKSKNQRHIKSTAESLMEKTLNIEKPNGGWLLMNWVASCEYKPGEGVIELEFSQKMRPYLLDLRDRYTGYDLAEVMQLNSQYSIRLYELLIQWENTRHKSLIIEVEELRKKMGLNDGEYNRFDRFEDRVIKTAVTEINNQSNIIVTYEKIKKGRRIHEIKFRFEIKTNEKLKQMEELQRLKDEGLTIHIESIKELFNDEKLIFTDLEIDKAYMIVFNKLNNIKFIQDCLNDAIYRYMLYYYNLTKERTGRHSYNYYLDLLENDYAGICRLYGYGRSPQSIIYGDLL